MDRVAALVQPQPAHVLPRSAGTSSTSSGAKTGHDADHHIDRLGAQAGGGVTATKP